LDVKLPPVELTAAATPQQWQSLLNEFIEDGEKVFNGH
jgi:hypothetical protein